MAERRMFTMKICDSDAFLDMPLSSQALYFHLNMRADDDGFINNPKRITRTIGASEDDLKLLIAKRFLLVFGNGVIVIKHWRMHNLLRKDRYTETQYTEEKAMLELKDNGAYTEKPTDNHMATTWQPTDNHMATQVSVGKVSIGKDSVGKCSAVSAPQTYPQPVETVDKSDILHRLGDQIITRDMYDEMCSRAPKQHVDATIKRIIETPYHKCLTPEKIVQWASESAKKKPKNKGNRFNNMPQREYDYKDLEAQLLQAGQ